MPDKQIGYLACRLVALTYLARINLGLLSTRKYLELLHADIRRLNPVAEKPDSLIDRDGVVGGEMPLSLRHGRKGCPRKVLSRTRDSRAPRF